MTTTQIPLIKIRSDDAHKGRFGRALIVGGSRGMSGAPALSGIAALRSGAGLVTVAVPDRCLETVAGFHKCFMTVALPNDDSGRITSASLETLIPLCEKATTIGIGPGIGRSTELDIVVKQVYEQFDGPMVVDADALNALAGLPEFPTASGSRILTPHIGEFRRLAGHPDLTASDCRSKAREFAKKNNVIVVLKGPRTLVTDGRIEFENKTGNPGMATGGSGDVLTGIITALTGQDYSPFEAAVLGVAVHGSAGDLARDRLGEISLTADDLLDHLGPAFKRRPTKEPSTRMGF